MQAEFHEKNNKIEILDIQQDQSTENKAMKLEPDVFKKDGPDSNCKEKSNSNKQKLTLEDFEMIGSLGNGSFGEVSLVKKKGSEDFYAMKSINKNFLFKEKKQYQVYIEREVLMKLSHPNLIKLFFSFQDKYKLYFVLEYCDGGEFSDFLKINKKLDKKVIQFYVAEIVNILEFLHANGIAHRDLKPENLMLTRDSHLKIIDFGTAFFFKTDLMDSDLLEKINKIKQHEKDEDIIDEYQSKHKATFVGTAEYVSPELLEDDECSSPSDLWALGCIIYKMFVGKTPFIDQTEYLIFQKIKTGQFSTNSIEIPDDAKDLIKKLLIRVPSKRLGAGPKGSEIDFTALKSHKFFEGINFEGISSQEAPKLPTAESLKKLIPSQNSENNGIKQQKTFYDENGLDLIKNVSNLKAENPEHLNETMGVSVSLSEGKILLTGLVLKKCGWIFYKPRQLILKDNHRLLYYDPQSNKLKGEIKLNSDVKIEIQEKKKFIVTIPTRKYFFKEMEHPATMWVELIFNVINN